MIIIGLLIIALYLLGTVLTARVTIKSAKKYAPGNNTILFYAVLAAFIWPLVSLE